MSDNSKTTPNDALSFELGAWLDHTQQLDQEATPGPWKIDEHDPSHLESIVSIADDRPWGWVEVARSVDGDAEWIAHTRTALPAAIAAIRAVLDIHQPVVTQTLTPDGGAWEPWCVNCAIPYPCRTVEAIIAALTSHQHPTPLGSSGKCGHEARGVTWAEQGTTAYACNTCEHEWTEEGG